MISFIIPAFNEENYLAACVKAIQREITRTKIDAEIIVVNNNSTDDTVSLALNLGTILINETERGVVAARKAGYLAAKGDLIANIDADTIIPEGWLSAMLTEFSENPDLVALSGPYIYYDMTPFQRFIIRSYYWVAVGLYKIVNLCNLGSMLQGGNAIISRKALTEAADAFSPNFSFYGEDTELARCLSKIGTVKFSLHFTALSSGRRLTQQGLVKTGLIYSINYFWTIIFKRPYTLTWVDWR